MQKQFYTVFLFLVFVLTLMLHACAPVEQQAHRENALPEVDVLQLKESSDAALKMARQMRMDIDAMNTRLAEMERMVVDLNQTVQNLPLARMDEVHNQVILLNEELQTLKIMVEQGAKVPTFHPKTIQKAGPPKEAPAHYKAALQAFDAKEYLEAIRLFELVASKESGDQNTQFADDAWFWIGECHFKLGDYARAIASYQRVFTFLHTDKGDDSQYKIAICYLKLGDRNRAATEFKKVEVLFPASEYVKKAKTELNKLGL
jgi:TolA-binding protein